MNLKNRVKNAYKALTNKQDKNYAMQQLIDFLGLQGTEKMHYLRPHILLV